MEAQNKGPGRCLESPRFGALVGCSVMHKKRPPGITLAAFDFSGSVRLEHVGHDRAPYFGVRDAKVGSFRG